MILASAIKGVMGLYPYIYTVSTKKL